MVRQLYKNISYVISVSGEKGKLSTGVIPRQYTTFPILVFNNQKLPYINSTSITQPTLSFYL